VLRHLATRFSERGGIENYQVTLSTSYAGFAVDLLQELINMVPRLTGTPMPEEDIEKLETVVRGISNISNLLFRVLAAPSVSRLSELYRELYTARSLSEKLITDSDSRAASIIAGRLYDIIRLLNISSYVAICRVLMGFTAR